MKNYQRFLLFFGFTAALVGLEIYFGLLNPRQLWQDVANADFRWVGLMVALTFVAHGGRAARWRILLEPLGYRPSFARSNNAVWLGYFYNNLIPRLGEVTRCSTLLESDGIPLEKSLGTVVTERIFDVLTLFVLLGLNLLFDFDRLTGFINSRTGSGGGQSKPGLWLLAAGVVLAGVLVAFFWKKLLQISLVKKVWGVAQNFLAGVLSIRQLRQPGLFLLLTALIWAMYWLMGYVLFFALPGFAALSPLVALTVLTSGALAMILPTPGGLGTVGPFVGLALHSIYGLDLADGNRLANFIQSSQMLCTLVIGLVFLGVTVSANRRKTPTKATSTATAS